MEVAPATSGRSEQPPAQCSSRHLNDISRSRSPNVLKSTHGRPHVRFSQMCALAAVLPAVSPDRFSTCKPRQVRAVNGSTPSPSTAPPATNRIRLPPFRSAWKPGMTVDRDSLQGGADKLAALGLFNSRQLQIFRARCPAYACPHTPSSTHPQLQLSSTMFPWVTDADITCRRSPSVRRAFRRHRPFSASSILDPNRHRN